MDNKTKIIFIPDIHFPKHDEKALNCVKKAVEKVEPTHIYFLGDVVDFDQLSKYGKDIRKDTLEEELNLAKDYFRKIRVAAGIDAVIVYKEGNHEKRLYDFLIRRANELVGLTSLQLPALMELSACNIQFIPHWHRHEIDDQLIITHGWHVNAKSGYSAHNSLVKSGKYNGISAKQLKI